MSPPDDPREVKAERTGWRDMSLSARHRRWGYDCPATDIDFLEYDHARPVALVEFKHERAERYRPDSTNLRACRRLADKAEIPFFIVIRADDFSWFEINAENGIARKLLDESQYHTSGGEIEFVEFLYWLRGRKPDEKVLDYLRANPFKPPTILDQLRKNWLMATAEEQATFLEEVVKP